MVQAGAVPFVMREGSLQFALVSSRSRRGWVIPKGCIEPGESSAEAAEREAWEEAGVRGRLIPQIAGMYEYPRGRNLARVQVYLLEVRQVVEEWPERRERDRRWADPLDAVRLAADGQLSALLSLVPRWLGFEPRALRTTA